MEKPNTRFASQLKDEDKLSLQKNKFTADDAIKEEKLHAEQENQIRVEFQLYYHYYFHRAG